MSRERFFFTAETLNRAETLKKQSLTWAEVAERLHCNSGSLRVAICERRKGNTRAKEIADALGMEHKRVEQLLYGRCGFDSEMLEEYRRTSSDGRE